MRKLHIIPIIHSRQDLGSLDVPIQDLKNKLLSDSSVRSSQSAVESFWRELRLGIESWQIDFDRIVIYQDALPFTGHPEQIIEQKIVCDLAAKGSPNHQLLVWLMERGATLLGTESTELLMKEYDAVRKSLEDGNRGFEDESNPESGYKSLLAQRDLFIANRISSTLQATQLGILFIGMLHRVEDFLDGSIAVEHPFGKPRAMSKV
jgi:hypothetical protein